MKSDPDMPAMGAADAPRGFDRSLGAAPEHGGPAVAELTIDDRVAAAQLDLLNRSKTVLPINFINAAIIAAVLWDTIPASFLVLWVVLTGAVVIARMSIAQSGQGETVPSIVARRLRQHVVGAAGSGLLWGAICLASSLYDGGQENLNFLGFVIAGMTAGALSSMSPLRSAYMAYLATATGSLAVATFIAPQFWGVGMTVLLICYVCGMALSGRNFNRAIVSTIRLRIENELLAERLHTADAATATALRSKWETIAHLSHELRTPLNAVLGFSELMKQEIFGPLGSPRYLEYSGHVHDGGRRALDLIETILNVSYAESGRLTLEEDKVDLAALVENCLTVIAPVAAAKRMTITKTLGDLPVLRADRAKLSRAVANLLSNAVNYTPVEGSIRVIGSCDGEDGDCRIVIADSGIGMAPEDIGRALTPFVRLASALTHTVDGAGLGLTLAKRLIELHGGSLAIDSAPGAGTTVTVTLPGERRTVLEAASSTDLWDRAEPERSSATAA